MLEILPFASSLMALSLFWIRKLMRNFSFSSSLAFPSLSFCLACIHGDTGWHLEREKVPGGMCVFQASPSADCIHHTCFCMTFWPRGEFFWRMVTWKLDLPIESNDLTLSCSFGIWQWGGCFNGRVSLWGNPACSPEWLHTAVALCLIWGRGGGGRCSDLFWGAEASDSISLIIWEPLLGDRWDAETCCSWLYPGIYILDQTPWSNP